VDGRPIAAAEALTHISLYKPRNVLSTVEKETGDDRRTIPELVGQSGRLYPVERPDYESEGLILMANDRDLANQLTHPRHGHQEECRGRS